MAIKAKKGFLNFQKFKLNTMSWEMHEKLKQSDLYVHNEYKLHIIKTLMIVRISCAVAHQNFSSKQ